MKLGKAGEMQMNAPDSDVMYVVAVQVYVQGFSNESPKIFAMHSYNVASVYVRRSF